MDVIESLSIERWSGPFAPELQRRATDALESGKVLYCPKLAFAIEEGEQALLSPALSNGKAKNISLDPLSGACQGLAAASEVSARVAAMMERFARAAGRFVADLFPGYAAGLERARTSYRPVEIEGRGYSALKDDKLLHVDAFPSRPTHGRRILRLFSNVDPYGKLRLWHVGEPFETFARQFLPRVRKPLPGEGWLLESLGITKGRRGAYDHLMLGLHDRGKRDADYQKTAPQEALSFPAGSTWLCYTDQVLHAALGGQFALEQTFHLDIEAMADPLRSPLKVLERLTGQALV
ncbi:MAG TPA: Kdo hydroxylase family protein [Alphaproteobacteria bacterium]|nr:Kdo hydroxylase family protein [Alphaproteobacteria bacterium]